MTSQLRVTPPAVNPEPAAALQNRPAPPRPAQCRPKPNQPDPTRPDLSKPHQPSQSAADEAAPFNLSQMCSLGWWGVVGVGSGTGGRGGRATHIDLQLCRTLGGVLIVFFPLLWQIGSSGVSASSARLTFDLYDLEVKKRKSACVGFISQFVLFLTS